jgi:hypothetical protein
MTERVMMVETPQPRKAHLIMLSRVWPCAADRKAVITEMNDAKPIQARSMKTGRSYNVKIYNKSVCIDIFVVSYEPHKLIKF